MKGLTINTQMKTPDYLINALINLHLKPTIVYWLCSALNAQCKGLVVTSDQAKRLVPYLIKTITDSSYRAIEDLTAMATLLGSLMVRFPGTT